MLKRYQDILIFLFRKTADTKLNQTPVLLVVQKESLKLMKLLQVLVKRKLKTKEKFP